MKTIILSTYYVLDISLSTKYFINISSVYPYKNLPYSIPIITICRSISIPKQTRKMQIQRNYLPKAT